MTSANNKGSGEPDRIRTCDPLIKSQLLYQLSYGPTTGAVIRAVQAGGQGTKRSLWQNPCGRRICAP